MSDCIHATVIKDMCADCGADLRQDESNTQSEASVPMVHSVPELKVSHDQAQELGKADTARLLQDRKLVLLVDLDQTLIHTTNDDIPNNLKGNENVFNFKKKTQFCQYDFFFDFLNIKRCISLSIVWTKYTMVSHTLTSRHLRIS